MGHGGTLDPMATGVLILGVGSGTKHLSKFLECTKSYEAVVLFGAATDSYDAVGKVVARKPYDHITKDMVETALQKFKGKIMQRPPLFSALRIQGKRLYEYAREGLQVPVQIEERPVEVEQLEMLEWMEGGTHTWQWPTEMARTPERQVAEQTLQLGSNEALNESEIAVYSAKRKHSDDDLGPGAQPEEDESTTSLKRPRTAPSAEINDHNQDVQEDKHSTPKHTSTTTETSGSCPAPACRLRMTVTSGFYVRSLCHDLGAAVGSLALMSRLVRTRQGDFELDKNVLEYSDLAKGDAIWEPKVESMLEAWRAEGRTPGPGGAVDKKKRAPQFSPKKQHKKATSAFHASLRRRNSSSGEE